MYLFYLPRHLFEDLIINLSCFLNMEVNEVDVGLIEFYL